MMILFSVLNIFSSSEDEEEIFKFQKSNQEVLSVPVKFTVLVLKCHGYRFSFKKQSVGLSFRIHFFLTSIVIP